MRSALTFMILATLAVPGCRKDEPAAPAQLLKIAVIPKATNHEYWKAIHAGAIKAQRELEGVQIIWKGPAKEDDRAAQINVVENFVNAGVSGIVVAPLDSKALVKPIQDATRAKIPVVIMDSGLEAKAGHDFVSYVATDNYGGGKRAAQCMGELLDETGKVLVLRYQVGSDSTTQREDGFLDGLKASFPRIEVVSSDQYAGPTSDSAYAKAENLLIRFPELDGIFSPCEPPVFGMLLALRAADRAGTVKLVGFDRSEKLVEAMRAGEIHGLVLQDPLNMGSLAVKTLVAHLRGEEVAPRIDTGSVLVTPANMNEPRLKALLSPPIEAYLR
jgi:ribose transport system substrate-binding protein